MSDAVKNHAIALRPMRPIDSVSPICAIPTTNIEKTRGVTRDDSRRFRIGKRFVENVADDGAQYHAADDPIREALAHLLLPRLSCPAFRPAA
jgi:hypothetical protein